MDLLETKQDAETCVEPESERLSQTSVQSLERPEQNHIHGLVAPCEEPRTESLCAAGREGEESEREETESSDDNTTQYSIHPPHDCPYLLLLQGCSPAQVSCPNHQRGSFTLTVYVSNNDPFKEFGAG